MVFSSMLFVFLFLAANLISQVLCKTTRTKNIAMLVFSLVFYGWAGPRYLVLLIVVVLVCWLGALMIESSRTQRIRKAYMVSTVAICLVILGIFKYAGFLAGNLQAIFGIPKVIPEIVLPIGISFYTFQLLSYVVDVYRGEVSAQPVFWKLLLYASLFHQCIAGPIVRYQDVEKDLETRKPSLKEISNGIGRFTVGLAKKAILANGCAAIADAYLLTAKAELAAVPALGVLLGLFAFTLQIYLDFSAYSDMAIGMGLMCGLHYKENFDYPYTSHSIAEFWRRWHISLGSFFRDYVYIPLGGNRRKKRRQIFNLFVVWFLTGLWHGASWNFVLWGLFFGLLIGLERFVLREKLERLAAPWRRLLVFVLVMFGWLLFKYTDMSLFGTAFKGLFGLNHNGFSSLAVGLSIKNNWFFLIVATLAVTPCWKALRQILRNLARQNVPCFWVNGIWEVIQPVLLLILSAMALAGNSYNPFLYFQF
ncbi:MAG: MBOAT family protein [Oscillospiraceae bacterium]|nr:MBOAT family protein [Oscillospiraceae bacterium]